MEKLNMQTPDMVDENIKKIGELFPNCITERKNSEGKVEYAIDFDKLKQELSKDIVYGNQERFAFTWPDKKKAMRIANLPINKTLRPVRSKSVNFDKTKNLYIEGDNLDVLKLLRENYLHSVKMIYIDPPYNTGKDFVYKDNFSQSFIDYATNSGQTDEEGNQLFTNKESNGRFHTDWLNMMYPRLKVSRDLLSDDGVIFISIDDGESDNLRKICNEIFGESNFVADITVVNNLKGRNDKKYIARANERLLMYVKSQDFEENGLPLQKEVVSEYKETDSKGKFRLLELRKRGGADTRKDRPNMYYPFYVNPVDGSVSLEKDETHSIEALPIKSDGVDGRWRWGAETAQKNIDYIYGKKVQGKDRYNIYEKDYLNDDEGQRRIRPKSVMSGAAYSTDGATKEYRALMKPIEFDSPKPVAMMKDLIEYSIDPDEEGIVLDFFSGSATTAHAVMQLNAEDGGNRKFIMVQIPEETDDKSEAYKAGYKTICDIGEERIRRAGKKIMEGLENKEPNFFDQGKDKKRLDIGFRVLKVDSTNMTNVYYRPKEYTGDIFDYVEDNIKSDRTAEDLLFQVMLEMNIPLSAKIEKETIDGNEFFNVADGVLIASFDKELTDEAIIEVAKRQPLYFVMRNSSAASDSVITNFDTIFKTYSKDTVRKIL